MGEFPLLYCLLPGQTRQVYSTCLSILVDAFDQLPLQPQVKRVVADFELAIHQAVAENFSGVSVKGCFFHFAQAVWRKVQHLGLQSLYKTDATFNKFICKVLALSLCPVSYVQLAWISVKASAPPHTTNPLLTSANTLRTPGWMVHTDCQCGTTTALKVHGQTTI